MTTAPARVIQMAAYGGPYAGSFIPMLEAIGSAVRARGWSSEMVFTDVAADRGWCAELRDRGLAVTVAPELSRRAAIGWTRRHLGATPSPVILHTHFGFWDLPALLAARGRSPRAAVVWHVHSVLYDDAVRRVRNLMSFGVFGRMTDRILCVGPDAREKVLSRGAPRNRTQVLANAVDLTRFAPVTAQERSAARARLALASDREVLLSFCWDWERKGGPLVLATVDELRRRGRDAIAVIVGSEDRARALAAARGLEDAVRVIGPADDVRELYAAADLFVTAAHSEPFGWAPLEAALCGTPVVGSDIPGHRFSVGGLPACRLADRTPATFADAVETTLDTDPAQRARQIAESQELIRRERSLGPWAERLVSMYAEILDRAAPRV